MKLPKHITGPFASRINGEWRNHRTALGAWRRVWGQRGVVVEVGATSGTGHPLQQPARHPASSGGHASQRRNLGGSDADWRRWDAAAESEGLSWAEWARRQLDRASLPIKR